MGETEGASTMLNLRIDAAAHKTMTGLAKELNVSLTAMVRPWLMWATAPANARAEWLDAVRDLRELIAEAGSADPVHLKELSDQEYFEHEAMCQKLQQIGFIDDFKSVRARRDGYRLCTYKLTETGRIVARVFQDSVADACDEVPLDIEAEAKEEAV